MSRLLLTTKSIMHTKLSLLAIAITFLIVPAFSSAPDQPYHVDCMKFPDARHAELPQIHEDYKWDPSVHLQIEPPEWVKKLDFEKVDFPTDVDRELAYSAPFRVISEEGLSRLRESIDANAWNIERTAR